VAEISPVFLRVSRQKIQIANEYIIGAKIDEVWMKKEKEAFFAKQTFKLGTICDGDKDKKMKFSIHFKEDESEITNMHLSITNILDIGINKKIPNPDPAWTDKLMFSCANLYVMPNMVDYLRSGWQIGLTTAIDYTASNGDPMSPQSLHAVSSGQRKNQYKTAIENVGMVLEPYDVTKQFPVFGFGGVPPGKSETNFCFPLTGNPAQPCTNGI
jgi:hypothetical protein